MFIRKYDNKMSYKYSELRTSVSFWIVLFVVGGENEEIFEATLLKEAQQTRRESLAFSGRDLMDFLVLQYVAAIYTLEFEIASHVRVQQ